MRLSKNWPIFLGILLLSVSCRKDPYAHYGQTTPYEIDYPVRIAKYLPPVPVPTDNPMSVEGVELGRKLFFDERFSEDNTKSCASCHDPAKAFSDVTAFSLGIDGLPGKRNSMPLFNLGWMDVNFWDGRKLSLEEQAYAPVNDPLELHSSWPTVVAKLQADSEYPQLFEVVFGSSTIDSTMVVKALAQFERTLISGNSPMDKYMNANRAIGSSGWNEADELAAYLGFTLFIDESKGDCFHCHGDNFNPLWTDNLFHNNGLDAVITDLGLGKVTGNPSDNGKFKTPSLRNLAFTAPYMHDGRFATLDEVINHYSEGLNYSPTIDPLMKKVGDGGAQLSSEEKYYLKMFLLSLSDSTFINNPAFADPG
ncbi:MAG: cytochrome-c peroxidase [Crocinitomix sp.]|nr:cytochrome-c peroxidase [Crocinitomix sp.]